MTQTYNTTEIALRGEDYSTLIEQFMKSQDIKQSSRDNYRHTIKYYLDWVAGTGRQLNALTRVDIIAYKDSLIAAGKSNLTIASYLVSVRRFYDWAEAEGLYPNIARTIKTPRKVQAFKKEHLTNDESKALLAYYTGKSLRDYAIVNLILRTGLRTIEVVRANVGDIKFKAGRRVLYVLGKGHDAKDSFVILSDKAYEPIAAYLATRKGAKEEEPLFVSTANRNNGERLTTRTISGLCKEGLKAIGRGGREYTAHSLRHTAAVALVKTGGTLAEVQRMLRHASPVTTKIYLESAEEDMYLQNAPELRLDMAF